MSSRVLDLKVTYHCNNDCVYCCQERELRSIKSDLDINIIKKILLVEDNIDKVVLTGGEPTLNEDIIEIIKSVREKGIPEIQLQSNAKKLGDSKYLEEVIRAGVNSFGISLHGHTKNIHESFTGTKGSFDEVICALKNIRKYQVPVALNCVITKHNLSNLNEIVCYISDNHLAESIQFAFIHMTGKAENSVDDYERISVVAREIRKVIEKHRNEELKIYTEAIPFCLMYGCEKNVSELYNVGEVVTYDINGKRDFSVELKKRFKKKSEKCLRCLFNSICDGPWSEYPDLYGFEEFIPVQDFRCEY